MDPVKEAFNKVKQDTDSLRDDLDILRRDLAETRDYLSEITQILVNFNKKMGDLSEKVDNLNQTHNAQNPTTSTHPSTLPQEIGGLKPQNLAFSTGNGGVSTDRQTDRQTDNPAQNTPKMQEKTHFSSPGVVPNVNNVVDILNSLDTIKKEIRLKFKRLTEQEWLVFSTIYQLDEQNLEIDYKILSDKLKLTESSIRDYVGRLIKKGIPIEKKKINNKSIHLFVSENLKKIASLSTIMQLRGI